MSKHKRGHLERFAIGATMQDSSMHDEDLFGSVTVISLALASDQRLRFSGHACKGRSAQDIGELLRRDGFVLGHPPSELRRRTSVGSGT